jgi:hypothetical protein
MKKLNSIDLENVSGGSWLSFAGGFCAGIGLGIEIAALTSGVGAPLAGVVGTGCLAVSVASSIF